MRLPTDPTGRTDRPLHLVYDDELLAARDVTGRALRRLGEAVAGRSLPVEDLDCVARWANTTADALERHPAMERADDYQARRYTIEGPHDGDRMISFSDRPVSGPANPTAHDLVVWRDGSVARAVAHFGRLTESSPGRVHGGVTASAFDDVMGYVMVLEATAAYTGELFVRYRAPMLVGVPVHFAAWVSERGPKVWTISATAHAGTPDGELVSEANGRFVVVSPKTLGVATGA